MLTKIMAKSKFVCSIVFSQSYFNNKIINSLPVLKVHSYEIFSNASIGESSLDRISCSLGGKFVLNSFLHIVPRMMQDG